MYVRYRNSTGVTATQNFIVNGRPQLPLSFPQTETSPARGNQYSMLEIDVTLPKGNSQLKFYEGPFAASVSLVQLTTAGVRG